VERGGNKRQGGKGYQTNGAGKSRRKGEEGEKRMKKGGCKSEIKKGKTTRG